MLGSALRFDSLKSQALPLVYSVVGFASLRTCDIIKEIWIVEGTVVIKDTYTLSSIQSFTEER